MWTFALATNLSWSISITYTENWKNGNMVANYTLMDVPDSVHTVDVVE